MKNNEHSTGLTANFGRDSVALQSLHARGEVDGLLMRMKLRQVYRNTTGKDLETVYAFPLAWGTTLLGLRVELNGKSMDGCVTEKSDAEARYEQAFEDGDLPVMLVREGKDLYSARIGNLKDGDEAVIEIEYGQLLAPDQGRTRITVPTTIAPRFGRDPGLRGLVAHAIGAIDPQAEYRFFLSLEIRGPLAHGLVACPSHAVSQQTTASGVSVQLSQRAMLDRDFILTIDADEITSTLASPDPGSDGACTLLTSLVPNLPAAAQADTPLRLKLLVDCSGSMSGNSMRLAKEALATVARQLRPTDAVSFSRFGSETVHVFDRLVPTSKRNLAQLLQEIGRTDADMGGTELASALQQVIALTEDGQVRPDAAGILLITDGEVWAIDEVIAVARHAGHQVYVIGVGSSPAQSLVGELAEVTGGAAVFASPGEDMAAIAERLVARARSVRDIEVAVDTGEGSEPIRLPRSHYRIAAGEILHLWYPMPHRPATAPRIVITDRSGGAQQCVSPASVEWNADGTVARIGAAQRLYDMPDSQRRLEIALKYQLITEQTNFILVHQRDAADKATGIPELQQVPNMPAAGWGGRNTVAFSYPMYDQPRFMRRQVMSTDEPSPLAFWRRAASPEPLLEDSINPQPSRYAGIADAMANPKDPANPLKLLAQRMDELQGTPGSFAALAVLIRDDAALDFLLPLLDELEPIAGDREAAVALLLDWVRRKAPPCMRLSRQARALLDARVALVAPAAIVDVRARLAAEGVRTASGRHNDGEDSDEIPAFLRQPAD